MQLAHLKVRNIRSYRAADLALGPGTTLLVGDVGSGKTSLLYAIEMALFGFAEVDPTYLVRHRAPEAEVLLGIEDGPHRYELGRRFRRKVRKGRDVFELEENSFAADGARTLYSATEVRQRAIDLLGFPDNPNPRAHSDLWRWAVFVPQERMREILEQPPEDRLETVRKALGLEQYRTAADNAALVAAELRRLGEHRRAEAQGLEPFERALADLAREVAERTEEGRRESDAAASLRASVGAATEEVRALEASEQALARDRAELGQLTERVGELARAQQRRRNRLAEVDREAEGRAADGARVEEEERALASVLAEIARVQADAATLRAERDRNEPRAAELASARAAADAARAARDRVGRDLEAATREAATATAETERLDREGPTREPPAPTPRGLAAIDAERATAAAELETAVEARARVAHVRHETEELLHAGICPRCHQAVRPEEFAGHLAEADRSLAEADASRERLQARLRAVEEERRARERYERNRARWEELERARTAARTAARAAVGRREELVRRGADLDLELAAQARKATELAVGVEEFVATRTRLAAVEADLERLRSESARRTAAREAARASAEAGARLAVERTRLGQEIEAEEGALADLRRRESGVAARLAGGSDLAARRATAEGRLAQARADLETAGRAAARAEALLETARRRVAEAEAQTVVRRRLLAEAAEREGAGRWLAGPFREGVLTLEHRLLARAQAEFDRHLARNFAILVEDPSLVARSDVQFSPSVEIDGELTPAAALSGGERTALALAFRLALGSVVRAAGRLQLDTLVLDEPTDGFSPEQVTRMGELLEGLGIPQILLVSHEAQLGAIADRVVRVRKDDGASRLVAEDGTVAEPEAPAPAPRARRVRRPKLDAPPPGPPAT